MGGTNIVDPNIDCLSNSRYCHPKTLVEHYLQSQIAQIDNNTNELAGLELALANVTSTALSSAVSFIRQLNGTQDINPDSEFDQTENLKNFQKVEAVAQRGFKGPR